MALKNRKPSALHDKRALITWVIAYLSITAAGIGLFFLIAALQHTGSYASPVKDPSYLLEERFLPLANLLLWTACGLAYFWQRRDTVHPWSREPLRLGALWLALAVTADFLDSVAIKNPESMSAHDFYIGQAPWIYLIYAAVFISPACAAAIRPWRRRRHRGQRQAPRPQGAAEPPSKAGGTPSSTSARSSPTLNSAARAALRQSQGKRNEPLAVRKSSAANGRRIVAGQCGGGWQPCHPPPTCSSIPPVTRGPSFRRPGPGSGPRWPGSCAGSAARRN